MHWDHQHTDVEGSDLEKQTSNKPVIPEIKAVNSRQNAKNNSLRALETEIKQADFEGELNLEASSSHEVSLWLSGS